MTSKRMLVILPTWVGDCVMATPVLRALRSAFPNAHILAGVGAGIDTLLAGSEWCNAVLRVRFKGTLGPFTDASLLRACRADTIVLLPNSFRTALGVRFAGATRRIGYARDGRGILLTDRAADGEALLRSRLLRATRREGVQHHGFRSTRGTDRHR